MKKTAVMVVAVALVAAVAAGAGGYLFGKSQAGTDGRGPGGTFAQLTEAERQSLQTMSAQERQAFFDEKGIDAPAGGPGGGMVASGTPGAFGGPGGGPGGVVSGEVIAIDAETVTVKLASGGSQKVYVDDATVRATADGSSAKLAVGADVIVLATPEADNVLAATAIVVK